ncbi:unnamed protein product [Symbiodinium pilosum]|uniref:Uncharacterized protein n=1 Tax=Symbiodinium pilosum TaxID=2952 RepID=A0A812WA98_SYMPI|nr:unnamed protein product [Symbiodinium pilosum]
MPAISRSGVFVARWGVGQRLLMLGALLLGCVTTGLALWLLTQGEAGVWEAALALDIPGLGCLLFGLGMGAPTSLSLVERDGVWHLDFEIRCFSLKSQPLQSLTGITEVASRAITPGVKEGYATGVPTWELTFPGAVVWIVTLEDHVGFLEELVKACEASNHRLTAHFKYKLSLCRIPDA